MREGFERIALVLRSDLWMASGKAGLNPTQAQALALLAERAGGLRAKEIAAHLAVSPPTIADTLAALERKGLVARAPDPADARAMRVMLTDEGQKVGRALAQSKSQVTTALAMLSPDQQADLLLSQIRIIRSLQLAGAIPEQRICVSCRHFRPNAYPGAAQPHHCAFVNAAIGDRDLRLDCGEHEAADPSIQSANWMAFDTARPPFQATPDT
ncbi:MAG: MarR family transcriptional regulator [Roseomonas sp.]|nr:MarR family transcriptional regulator [Roseomonas sp.]MCA3302642.1 MarR family transcriptional regulator [Roseomonas sp.]MCA3306062.1 MarR family transcriptional regulator [Roseomonas sp.]MCA3307933.1 MarR family transcriptional regulator [Roseomonas sp.]MCA3313500.1 MarR family transcriptional regulator [Roseomonas sp.]